MKTVRSMRLPLSINERIPITEFEISLSTMTVPSPMMVFCNTERVTLAGGSVQASVNSGMFDSYRLNAGWGWASMMLVSKNDRTVPMSFQYPANGNANTRR